MQKVYSDEDKKSARGLLFVAWCYSTLALLLGLWKILSEIFHAGFNFWTIPAITFCFQYCYALAYLFQGFNRWQGAVRFGAYLAFAIGGLNILILVAQFWNDKATTQDINNMIAVFLVATSHWVTLSAALLNVLRMEHRPEEVSQVQYMYVPIEQLQQFQTQPKMQKVMV